MTPLTASEIRGNWATLLSVWNENDSLDLQRVGQEIDTLIAQQVDGIYSNGTAGEFHTQTETEFDQISELLAKKCTAANMPFQIGVSHMCAQISRDRLLRIVHLAPSAIQLILPDWFPVTNTEAITFLSRMADIAGNIGLILYNPPHAKRVLAPEDIADLSQHVPSLIGLKTAGGDTTWYTAMRKHLSHLSVFVPGHLLATGIHQGANGAYSNVACLNPKAAQKWTHLMNTDLPAALEIEQRLQTFMSQYIAPYITEQHYCNAACDRFMALIGNWADTGNHMRWPYRSIPISDITLVRKAAQKLIPEFMEHTPG